ncbi:MAG: hypothetical protein DWQ36_06745 [Acidobacteria bacterium]|nr:MAG: hypothetical protein DWQ30_24180 [Acidobacteriota bacterium]REK09247.1 MAG: hypothetical protein DWQ36_06745 [Acidobacteriota bacterium]
MRSTVAPSASSPPSPLRRWLTWALPVLAAAAGAQTPAPEETLWAAARGGDLLGVQQQVAAGVAVDAKDRYGATALFKAAAAGHGTLVAWLLERGADPSVRETFWGQSALFGALAGDHHDVAVMLLEAGAEGREDALEFAFATGLQHAERRDAMLRVATAAVDSGPLYASFLQRFRARLTSGPWAELLQRAESRPDPPPPALTAADLEPYVGDYEGWSDDTRVEARIVEGRLELSIDGGESTVVEPVAEKTFRSADGAIEAAFFGRFGSLEGLGLARDGSQTALRRSVAEPVADAPAPIVATAAAGADEVAAGRETVHWPGFRGANGDGVGDGVDAPVSWDLARGESLLWRVDLPGLGNSSPVVWGSRVFVTTAIALGGEQEQNVLTGDTGTAEDVEDSLEHSWQVLAFDKRSGERLWVTEVGRAVPETRRHLKATQANSTPVTDGERLVVVFPTVGIACLDLDGRVLWQHDLGPLNASNFFDPEDQWGFASSPILYRNTVILQVDVYGGGYLAAWRLADGKQVWKTERDVAPSWSTPTLLRGEKGDELVTNASVIHGYDPATGEELWSLGPNSELVVARPVAGDGVVYVSAGYPPVKPVYAVRAGLRGEIEVTPGDEHGALLWSHRIGGAYMPSPLLYRGIFYIVHHNGRIVAYDAASGAALYKQRFSRSGTFTGSPVANNGRLYVPTEGGLLYVLKAGPRYEELAINDFDEPLMATPAISEGILLVRTPAHLFALAHERAEGVEPKE